MEVLLYAWSEDLGEFVKVQCDEDGNLKIDMSEIDLNDLADVDAESPGDGEFLSFDLASGTWQARALTDADIPDTIARDAEVTTAINNHAANASAHHAKYTDAEAVTAMGAKADNNPLNHDRYDDTEAVAAMGTKADSNPLNHDKYEAPDPTDVMDEVDDFISGVATSGQVGKLGWSYSAAGLNFASEDGHPGYVYLYTNAVLNDIAAMWLMATSGANPIRVADLHEITFIVKTEGLSDRILFVGAMNSYSSTPGNQDRFGFEYDTGQGDTNWMLVTGDGANSTRTDSGVAVAADTWYKLKVVHTATGYEFYINGTLKGTNTTYLPNTSLQVGVMVKTLAAAEPEIDVDFFRWKLEGLSR